MPKKTLEKPKEIPQPQNESSSESESSSSSEEIIQTQVTIIEPVKPIVEQSKKKQKPRKTANDEELLKIKQENFAKAVAKSVEVRKQKKEQDMEKAKKEQEEKDALFKKAKEDAYKEVYERLLIEQKIALKKEMNSKLKLNSNPKAEKKKIQKSKEVLEAIAQEQKETASAPVISNTTSSKVEISKAPPVVVEPVKQPIKLSNRQILSMYGF